MLVLFQHFEQPEIPWKQMNLIINLYLVSLKNFILLQHPVPVHIFIMLSCKKGNHNLQFLLVVVSIFIIFS